MKSLKRDFKFYTILQTKIEVKVQLAIIVYVLNWISLSWKAHLPRLYGYLTITDASNEWAKKSISKRAKKQVTQKLSS